MRVPTRLAAGAVWPYPPALFRTDWVGGGPPLCAPGTSGTGLVNV